MCGDAWLCLAAFGAHVLGCWAVLAMHLDTRMRHHMLFPVFSFGSDAWLC